MIFRSVSARLATWMLLGSALVLGVTGAALLEHTRRQVLAQTHREALALANGTAARIAARVSDAMAITRVLHTVLPAQKADADAMLPDVVRGHPDLSGIVVSFTPAKGLPRTTLLVVREPGGAIRSVELAQDKTDAWYAQGLSCADGCWQRSFMADTRGGSVVGFVQPMERNAGVVASELTLDWLQALLGSLPEPAGGYAFVMDENRLMLAHERPGFVGTRASSFLTTSIIRSKGAPMRLTAADGARVNEPSWAYVTEVPGTPWQFGLVIPESRIYTDMRRTFLTDLALGLFGLLAISALILTISRRLLAPLSVLTLQAERIAAGDRGHALPPSPARDEVGRLTRSFEGMRVELAAQIEAVAEGSRASERLASELDIARLIQTSMLPPPRHAGVDFELHAHLQPAQAVGGDLYFYLVQPDRLWLMVGDVSDKGVAAALFMARTITLARNLARDAAGPDQLLTELNTELEPDNDACMFVTLVCATMDRATGSLFVASAGHEAPVLCRGETCIPLTVESGPALGLQMDAEFPLASARLLPGDELLMYSDGITEADNGFHELFGESRLLTAMSGPRGMGGRTRIDRLLTAVSAHASHFRQSDDIALLALNWQGRAMRTRFSRRIAPDRDAVFALLDAADAFTRDAGAGAETRADIRLAAEELLVNIVDHSSATSIDLSLEAVNDGFDLCIRDDGPPFDPFAHPEPVDHDQIGGLGIPLARQLADASHCEREPGGNVVSLRFASPSTP
ncbi:SpoIIE family protein phosphatase [Pinirhizobacter sp.]|jgi:sigma-B regulation protein RsbU (phosphoserine phosphatase)|uniref:SpoIIE family protein phosphatase n=1 Tax=Pinirhizobacter sp. TaxID=2950432 RepID=UPI002F411B4D